MNELTGSFSLSLSVSGFQKLGGISLINGIRGTYECPLLYTAACSVCVQMRQAFYAFTCKVNINQLKHTDCYCQQY